MKKLLLMSIFTCNFAFAGGQEGTGSTPEEGVVGTSAMDAGEHKVICIKQNESQGNDNIQCFVVLSNAQDNQNNNQ